MNVRKSTLQFKLMLFFSLLILSLALALSSLLYKSTEKAINLSKQKEILTLAEETSNKIDRFLFERHGDIQVMADSPLMKNKTISPSLKLEYLNNVRKAYKTYDYIIITDVNGGIKTISGSLNGDNNYKVCLPEIANRKVYVSDIMLSNVSGTYYIYFAAPIIDNDNNVQGAVIERMNFNSIIDILTNVHPGKKGFVYMLSDRQENILYPFNEPVKYIDFSKNPDRLLYSDHLDTKYLTAYFPLTKYDTQNHSWNVIVEDELQEAYAVTYRLRDYTIIVVAISALILIFFALILSSRITKPIKVLVQKTQSLAEGETLASIDISSRDEIGDIAGSFNVLLDNLKEMINQLLEVSGKAASLEEIGEYANRFFEGLPAAMITIDNSGKITTFNGSASEFFSLLPEEAKGKNIMEVNHSGIIQIGEFLLRGTRDRYLYNKRIVNVLSNKGQEKSIIISTSIQEDGGGNVLGVTAVFRSLEEIKRMEDNLNRSKNLEALGAMSAGIAHEIRNPLTSIRGFAQYIKASLTNDSELLDDINIILSEVDRLNYLVDRFLTFANPKPAITNDVNLNALIENAVRLLDNEFRDYNINLIKELGTVPSLKVDEDQFSQVLINIIINSIQAISANGTIIIRTHFIKTSNMVRISITDNGAGIPADILDKIFDPFFSTKDRGTGLGLAISARIIENHKGILEVESRVGLGTTFTMQLPS